MTSILNPDYLLTVHTLHSKLLLIARHAIVVAVLGDEALGSNGLLAALTGEASLMPAVALMLHLPGACKQDYGNECVFLETFIYSKEILD